MLPLAWLLGHNGEVSIDGAEGNFVARRILAALIFVAR
jgi:hypothetical protein